MRRLLKLILLVLFYGLFSAAISQAASKDKELTIIYTGETHAMLYHCACPIESDGGVARRATLIKQLRKEYPNSLVLDSGNFFGSGLLDQNTQNTQLDMQRSSVNLRAMGLMQYDALAISDDEFNFGRDFLEDNLAKEKLNFLSVNLEYDKIAPYIIKERAGMKIGIIGLTNPAVKQKSGDLKFIEPKVAVEATIRDLKKKGADFIIMLSNLTEAEDLKIIASVPGIDVVIDGHARGKSESQPYLKTGNSLILRPQWQGRKLGRAVLSIKDNKIDNISVEELRVSDKIADDAGITSILPRCFSDNDCKKDNLTGSCQNAGALNASCLFSEPLKVNLTVITSQDCTVCNPESTINLIKKQFPGVNVSYLYYPSNESTKMLEGLDVSALPVYILGKEIAKDKNFDNLKPNLLEKPNFYVLRPEVSGVTYLFKRERIKGKLDLFLSLYDKDSFGLLNIIREFDPSVHFLAISRDDKIETSYGETEVEEDLRAVCMQKYYPQTFWDYITCRSKNINSTWWEDCAPGVDVNKIKTCARGKEGIILLKENLNLSQELKVMFGPTYLLDNKEIFASKGLPSKEELKKTIKK